MDTPLRRNTHHHAVPGAVHSRWQRRRPVPTPPPPPGVPHVPAIEIVPVDNMPVAKYLASCPVCRVKTSHEALARLAVDGHSFSRCTSCGLVIARPGDVNEHADYSGYGEYLVGSLTTQQDTLRYTQRSSRDFVRYVRTGYGTRARILDFGAGGGFFVKAMRDAGFVVDGVEISDKLIEYSQTTLGVRLHRGLGELEGTYDAVHIAQVLEHVPPDTLHALLQALVHRLRIGGVFWGSTPNIESLNIHLSGKRDPVIAPPEHCTYFSCTSLDRFLSGHGLAKQRLFTSGMSSNSFLRRDRFTPSFLEKRPATSAQKWLLTYPLRGAFKSAGWTLSFTHSGYQIHFRYLRV